MTIGGRSAIEANNLSIPEKTDSENENRENQLIMRLFTFTAVLFAIAAAALLPAAEVVLDGCRSTANWSSFNGAEFKGAKVSLSAGADGLELGYDFSDGGAYVGCHPHKLLIPAAESLSVTVNASNPVGFNYRIIDANDRCFQGRGFQLKPGKNNLTLGVKGPWSSVWGGSTQDKQPVMPIKSVWLMANKGKDLPLTGIVTIRSFKAKVPALPATAVTGENFEQTLAGWTLKGEWVPQLEGAMLELTSSSGKAPAQLSIVFPQPGRDSVQRYRLEPGKTKSIYYKVPFSGEANPRNRYRITLRVESETGAKGEFVTALAGQLAGSVNLGTPKTSREIEKSKFGTCVHFSYAPKPEGPFQGWYPKELLLDEISRCGFKYIREGLATDQLPDGSWTIRDTDLDTLRKAKARGIEQIVVINMSATETIPDFLKRVRAVVEQSHDYVNVYELGNEPNNFGQWRQTYQHNGKDGNWNGWESDGTVSEWVKKHVEYTNAAADLIKQIAPEKTVIGLGSCTPTNFHALNVGVSKNLDGVVEHPYTYSMPPEKVPFGKRLTKRDGIAVGDDGHTFRGLVESYHEQFRKTGKPRSLWVTEFGFTTFEMSDAKVKGLYVGFSEQAQALYLLRRFVESLALPVAVSCQYDFLDDYGSHPEGDEANFGILRGDYSRKPAYYVLQRMNSLLAGAEPDQDLKIKITKDALHRSMVRGELVKDWDDAQIDAANGVRAYAFRNPATPNERLVTLWSMQPFSGEFNTRPVSLEIDGLAGFTQPPVTIDLITGDSFDLPVKFENGKATVTALPLEQTVLLLKFFR